jgi:hypothetical protein
MTIAMFSLFPSSSVVRSLICLFLRALLFLPFLWNQLAAQFFLCRLPARFARLLVVTEDALPGEGATSSISAANSPSPKKTPGETHPGVFGLTGSINGPAGDRPHAY